MPRLEIHVPASHLYRGLRLRAIAVEPTRASTQAAQQQADILLHFEDGSASTAELVHDERGRTALHVAGYRTTRGTSIAARMWTVKRIEERDVGFDIHLGERFPGLHP